MKKPDKSQWQNGNKMPTVRGLLAIQNQLLEEQSSENKRSLIANSIMILATIFLAITAGCDALTNREDFLSGRPYVSINPGLNQKESLRFGFETTLDNIGKRAISRGATIGIFPVQRLQSGSTVTYDIWPVDDLFISNELMPGSDGLTYSVDIIPPEIPDFLIIELKYRDAVLDHSYTQHFYYKWSISPSLSLVTDEKIGKDLADYFEKNN